MATFKWRSLDFPLPLLFFTLFNCTFTATGQVDICNVINCGQGTCQPTPPEQFPWFKCTCNPGWKKVEILGMQIPTLCLLPNCTFDFKCGNGLPPPLPPPLSFPLLNVTELIRIITGDPCSLAWCGDGTCERNGAEYNCKCHEGSLNLLNNPKLACLPKCSLGGRDCNGFTFGSGSPPPPQNSGSGPGKTPMGCAEKLHMLSSIILLATAFLAWI